MGMRWLLGFVLIAIVSLVLSLWGPISAPAQSERMGASIEQALQSADLGEINVEMIGNVAHLSGEALSAESMQSAIDVAKAAKCTDCKNSAPVWHEVKSEMTVKEVVAAPVVTTVSPYTFSATKKRDGNVLLDGYVRSDAELQRVMREANALFPGKVVNDALTVAEGAPNSSWGDVISKYLPILAKLDNGRFVLDDSQSLVTGKTAEEAVRNEILQARGEDLGYNEVINISVPNAASVFAGTVSSQSLCQNLFNDLKGDTKINFGSDSDVIEMDSFGLLESLSSAAKQCPDFRVNISGYTDSQGDPNYNIDLSQRRAQSVVGFLMTKGVDVTKLTSQGYGAANPVASNDTPEGRAANRRIEFTVTKSE